ncbi:hypothetical protein NDI49_19820 [Trichocoleus sp. ST-U3]
MVPTTIIAFILIVWGYREEQASRQARERHKTEGQGKILTQSSVLSPQSSVLSPQSSVLSPQSSVLSPQSSVLSPQSSKQPEPTI